MIPRFLVRRFGLLRVSFAVISSRVRVSIGSLCHELCMPGATAGGNSLLPRDLLTARLSSPPTVVDTARWIVYLPYVVADDGEFGGLRRPAGVPEDATIPRLSSEAANEYRKGF
jgi:hypothetical protein